MQSEEHLSAVPTTVMTSRPEGGNRRARWKRNEKKKGKADTVTQASAINKTEELLFMSPARLPVSLTPFKPAPGELTSHRQEGRMGASHPQQLIHSQRLPQREAPGAESLLIHYLLFHSFVFFKKLLARWAVGFYF